MQSDNLRDRVLVKVLGQLKPSDLEGLRIFLDCGLFNKNPLLGELLELVERRILRSRKKEVQAQDLLVGTEIPPKRLNKLFTQLFQSCNEYLEMMERRQNPTERYRYLFQAYSKLEVPDEVQQKEFKRANKLLRNAPLEPEKLQLEYFISHSANLQQIHGARRRTWDHFLDNQELLDQYYVTTRLRYLCALRNSEWMYSQEAAPLKEAEVIALFEAQESAPPLATAYFMALRLFQKSGTPLEKLAAIRPFLEAHGNNFPETDQRDLWGYVLNFCIQQFPRQRQTFESIAAEIYLYLLDNSLLLDEGKISAFHFDNIIKLRLKSGDFAWVKDFIEEYGSRLNNGFGGKIVQKAWGIWHYSQARFQEAVDIFKDILQDPPKDILWNIDLRSLLWRSYFERRDQLSLAETDEMEALYDSFRLFVARNENIPASFKENYQNFIRYFNRLRLLLEEPHPDRKALGDLQQEIQENPRIFSREWLLGHIEQALT